jgi:hypothetical protein
MYQGESSPGKMPASFPVSKQKITQHSPGKDKKER